MDENQPDVISKLNRHYFLDFALAYARGRAPGRDVGDLMTLFDPKQNEDLHLHRFKRATELPRVRRVLGILRGFDPNELLDIGSGRGVFLWPLLDAFPNLPVTALDRRDDQIDDLRAVAAGGIERLRPVSGDVTKLGFADSSFDGVTMLEVLEHLPHPLLGAKEILRVARRFAIVSVPSKPDDNPEHLHLFTAESLTSLFQAAADLASREIKVRCEYVLNHLIAVIGISSLEKKDEMS